MNSENYSSECSLRSCLSTIMNNNKKMAKLYKIKLNNYCDKMK